MSKVTSGRITTKAGKKKKSVYNPAASRGYRKKKAAERK